MYDVDGNRLARLNPDSTATLYIDGQEVSVVASIPKGTRYYGLAGTIVAQRNLAGLLSWQLADSMGSAQISLLAGSSLLIRTYYDPYGKVRDLSPKPATDHGYLGKVTDPFTGLIGMGARYYDPDLGRFTSPPQPAAQTDPGTPQPAPNLPPVPPLEDADLGITASGVGHLGLDLAGLVPGYGAYADAANAAWYAQQRSSGNALFSAFGAIPLLGDAAVAVKLLGGWRSRTSSSERARTACRRTTPASTPSSRAVGGSSA